MTKEELKQEAKERADEYTNLRPFHIGYEEGYFDGAEPREKRITELKYQLTHRNCLDCSNHSSKLRMRNLDLEKENAELKSENQKWKDEWQEQVQKATDEGYARTLQTMQLTKAKELLRKFMPYVREAYLKQDISNIKLSLDEITEAEQFLSEVEK